MRPVALAFACLVLVAGLPAGGATPATAQADELGVEYVVSRTPADPGHVDVTVRFDLPGSVSELAVQPPPDATVAATDGFEREDSLRWDGATRGPTVTYRRAVNVSVDAGGERGGRRGYLYADTGDWVLMRAPSVAFRYRASGELAVNRTVRAEGDGVAGGSMVFLGNHTLHERTAAGQRLRLVVPRAANLTESPDAILGAVGRASERLSFGQRDPTVTMVAAPTGSVRWASTGLQRGPADLWVRDVQAVGTAENVWVHEYVHTRQDYRTTDATRWTVEAAADYYAALVAYESGSLAYDEFRVHLREGRAARFEGSVLAEPSTWDGTLANYVKGALVLGALDRQVRLESGGDATLQDVFATAEAGERFEERELLDAVETAAGTETRAFAERHTRTAAVPEVWNRSEHREAFGPTSTFAYEFRRPFGVTGPYRTATLDGPTVPNETVQVRATVRNVGDTNGTFATTLYADGVPVADRSGELAAGTSRRLTLRVPVDGVPADGHLDLRLGGATASVPVEPPAGLSVTDLSAPERVRAGESFPVEVTVRNRADRPGERRVVFRVDGEAVAYRSPGLAPGDTVTVRERLTLTAGEYELSAGGRAVAVRAVTPTATGTATSTRTATASGTGTLPSRTPTSADGAGLGATGAVLAVALLVAVGRSRA